MDKRELIEQAKEAYYNTGQEIMSDAEYDELENELGLENKNYVGTRHNEQYTVCHPMIMGSLSKVQIKRDSTGTIDWNGYASEILNYVNRYNDSMYKGLIVTPKYDGCSFEIYYNNKKKDRFSFSTRGDGEYGKNILHIFENNHIFKLLSLLKQKTEEAIRQYEDIIGNIDDIVWRGEILVNKKLFTDKYKDQFTNPRSFVSGTVNAKFDKSNKQFLEQIADLSFVIYDIRYNNTVNGKQSEFREFDWTYVWSKLNDVKEVNEDCAQLLDSFPNLYSKEVMVVSPEYIKNKLSNDIYDRMDTVRKESKYALDGFVIKPIQAFRKNNNTEPRPKDCIAVKFLPQIADTKVKTIEWTTGKQGELFPVVTVESVDLDGKRIEHVSAHNFGYIYNNYITEGTELQISLAGDIIPFIYKVNNTDNTNIYKVMYENGQTDIMLAGMNVRNMTVKISDDMIHLYKDENETEVKEREFIERTIQAGIKSLGQKNTVKLAAWCRSDAYINRYNETDDFFKENKTDSNININIKRQYPRHLFELTDNDIRECFGGITAENIIKDIERAKRDMKLSDIIRSCCFKNCGKRASEICASVMVDGIYDTTGIEYNAVAWAFDEQSDIYRFVLEIIKQCNKVLDDYKEQEYFALQGNNNENKVYIIMTGEPTTCSSKSEFLQLHPEYGQTTSWKKCRIVFTNDLNSSTGKMKKAKDYINKGYNIEIKEY